MSKRHSTVGSLRRTVALLGAAVVACLATASVAVGQEANGPGHGGSYFPTSSQGGPSRASDGTRTKMLEAKAAYSKAEQAMHQVHLVRHREFLESAQWKEATGDLRLAQQAYEALKRSALAGVRDNQEYLEARNRADAARDRMEEMRRADPEVSFEQLAPLAREAMAAQAVMTRLEAQAISADPNTSGARERLVSANDRVNTMWHQLDDVVRADGEWQAARQSYVERQGEHVVACKEHVAAVQQEERERIEQERQARAMAKAERTKPRYASGGTRISSRRTG